jgi:predicted nucleotidyltransferase
MLSTEAKLTDLVSRMKEFAGENLESMILYGSAARGDFKEGHSDLNVLCVLRSVAVRELARVTPVVRWWSKDHNEPAPLFFTAEELRQSADVFSIELLDMQESRRVLFGADVVAGVLVPMNLHRVQVEHAVAQAPPAFPPHRAKRERASHRRSKVIFERPRPPPPYPDRVRRGAARYSPGGFRAHCRSHRRGRGSLYSRVQAPGSSRSRR